MSAILAGTSNGFHFIEALRVKSRVGIYPRERVAEQTLELNLTFRRARCGSRA